LRVADRRGNLSAIITVVRVQWRQLDELESQQRELSTFLVGASPETAG
jgi:hypothetical protein